jgi:ribonuclease VapC
MIVDTSALVAIVAGEPEREAFVDAILAADAPRISAASLLEVGIVVDRQRDPAMSRRLDDLVDALGLHVVPVSVSHAATGRAAYRDYGKGSGHPAGLNYGDCFAYALARESGSPLLFKGDDFIHTDLTPAARG